jgi:hypothetical protein
MTQLAKIEEAEIVADYNIDAFLEKRAEFIKKVNAIMVEKKDYHVIQGKKSLAKGGAEKIASIFGWTARFEKDQDVAEAFTEVKGLLAFVCVLSKGDVLVGQGRGASTLDKNGTDPNKTIKMAQKSAFIDAVLRASGLSDFFTQDLEDMPQQEVQTGYEYTAQAGHSKEATPKQKAFIKKLIKVKGVSGLSSLGFEDKPLTIDYAKQIIEKLLTLPDVDGADLGEPLEVDDKSDLPN